ncbi:MAG: hypothetical protein LC789_10035, partial [Actinobacteria bacterium]|nr:hypothetical protein [Actinomycetota bacterium]
MIPERSLSLRPPRYLHALLEEVDTLARRVAPYADDPRRESLHDDAALASVRLDGSRLETVPDADAIARARRTVTQVRASSATWLDALARSAPDDADHDVGALEFAGVRAAVAADDLAAALLTAPADALVELHRRLTDGLVPRADAGRPRESEQAVQDGSVGRVVFRTVPPGEVGARMAALC